MVNLKNVNDFEELLEEMGKNNIPRECVILLWYPYLPDGMLGKTFMSEWLTILYRSDFGSKLEKESIERLAQHETIDADVLINIEHMVDCIQCGRKQQEGALARWMSVFIHCYRMSPRKLQYINKDCYENVELVDLRGRVKKIMALARFRIHMLCGLNV